MLRYLGYVVPPSEQSGNKSRRDLLEVLQMLLQQHLITYLRSMGDHQGAADWGIWFGQNSFLCKAAKIGIVLNKGNLG